MASSCSAATFLFMFFHIIHVLFFISSSSALVFVFTCELLLCWCRWSSSRHWSTRSLCLTKDGHPATRREHFSAMGSSVTACKWVMCVYAWHPGLRAPKRQKTPESDAGLPLTSSVMMMRKRHLLPRKGQRTERHDATSMPCSYVM